MSWDDGWWAYAFIAIAGWLATDLWRWLGVLAGNRLREDSEALNWVRAVATALVAAVVAKLILYPTGILEQSPLWLRLGAIAAGTLAFFVFRQKPAIGIGTAIAALGIGLFLLGF
nr:AzlD domain-containing protein [Pararhizobium antarcticum]